MSDNPTTEVNQETGEELEDTRPPKEDGDDEGGERRPRRPRRRD